MGGLVAFPRAPGLTVLLFLLGLHLARAVLVPFTLSHVKAGLEARSLHTHANRLQPRHEVELHYADDEVIEQSYLATVVARHETCPYVLVESFEEMLADIRCAASNKATSSIRMTMKFREQGFLEQAQEAWQGHNCLVFITHHLSCNDDFKERASYRCSSWDFNSGDTIAVATCEPAPFGPDSDASTSLGLKGGLIQPEMSQRLRARTWPGRKRITKRALSTYTFSLDDSWAKSEYLIGLNQIFRLSCIDCHMRGAFAVGYNVDLRTPDWGRILGNGPGGTLSADGVKDVVQRMDVRLESTQPLDTALDFQLDVNTAVKFSWPGLTATATTTEQPTLGNKILRKKPAVQLLKIGNVRVLGNYRYGVSVALELYAQWRANFPVTATMPANQALFFDALNPRSSTNTFTPNVKFQPARVSVHQPEVCVSIGVGPQVDLTLEVTAPKMGKKGTKFEVSTQIGLEVPKVETCFSNARNVDWQCRVGNIAQAVKERTTLGLGLKFEVWFKAAKEGFVVLQSPIHKFDLDSLLDGLLHRTWVVSHHCFDIRKIARALGLGSPGSQENPPVPSPQPGPKPSQPADGPIKIPPFDPKLLDPSDVYGPSIPKEGSPKPPTPGKNQPQPPKELTPPVRPANPQPPPGKQSPPDRGTVQPPTGGTTPPIPPRPPKPAPPAPLPHEVPLDDEPYHVQPDKQSMSIPGQNGAQPIKQDTQAISPNGAQPPVLPPPLVPPAVAQPPVIQPPLVASPPTSKQDASRSSDKNSQPSFPSRNFLGGSPARDDGIFIRPNLGTPCTAEDRLKFNPDLCTVGPGLNLPIVET